MKFSQLAHILNGTLSGPDGECKNFSIDSRTVKNGDCFLAIRGEFFDGHDFISQAKTNGAVMVIVDRDNQASHPSILVSNTRQALITLARFYRASVSIPVAAITGSCGKTTTRALLENILKHCGHVLASQKSFNNDIGIPLTLLQLNPTHDFAVIEVGTNHPGEIAQLAEMVQPTVAVVTMVAPVHLAGFGNVLEIAREKGALFKGLKSDGIAVVNIDDVHAPLWKKLIGDRRMITFSRKNQADIMAQDVQSTETAHTAFTLVYANEKIKITLPLMGEHNVLNALAAAAVAFALKIPIQKIKQGLETAQPVDGRLIEKKGFSGALIIDDSYNANPASVKAAINVLTHRSNHSILVFGDMLELGDQVDTIHAEMGTYAYTSGIKYLLCYGEHSVHAAKAFGKNAQHFESQEKLIDALKQYLSPDVTVLIKGSHSMRMDKIANALVGV